MPELHEPGTPSRARFLSRLFLFAPANQQFIVGEKLRFES
jgi:hypothetical protein